MDIATKEKEIVRLRHPKLEGLKPTKLNNTLSQLQYLLTIMDPNEEIQPQRQSIHMASTQTTLLLRMETCHRKKEGVADHSTKNLVYLKTENKAAAKVEIQHLTREIKKWE